MSPRLPPLPSCLPIFLPCLKFVLSCLSFPPLLVLSHLYLSLCLLVCFSLASAHDIPNPATGPHSLSHPHPRVLTNEGAHDGEDAHLQNAGEVLRHEDCAEHSTKSILGLSVHVLDAPPTGHDQAHDFAGQGAGCFCRVNSLFERYNEIMLNGR